VQDTAVRRASAKAPRLHEHLRNISGVRGHVWELSQDAQGSRDVQAVLEEISSPELEQLAFELEGHILEAAKCPHANFVLQKCISRKAPKASRVIARELIQQGSEAIVQAAKHRYGCRIIERLLECCDNDEVSELSDFMLSAANSLCVHPYGNYTMQHILTHGSENHRQRLVSVIRDEVATMGANFHAAAVIGEALRRASRQDAMELAQALLQEPGLLSQMARTKHGHLAARLAVQVVDPCKMEKVEALGRSH